MIPQPRKRETMSTEKTATNFARLVTSMIVIAVVLVVGFYLYQGCNQQRMSEEKFQKQESRQQSEPEYWHQYHSIGMLQARLVQLANKGCEVPFKECLHPSSAKWRIFDIMDREKIPFGTNGVMSPDMLDQLVDMGEKLIARQKFAYLKAQGGVKFPSDIYLLGSVCRNVYEYKQLLLSSNPTDAELKQLLPPGITKVYGCERKDN